VRQSGDRLVDLSITFSVALAPILIASAARLLDTNAAGQTTFDRCSDEACACRNSNPNILVVQPAQDRAAKNSPG